MTGTLTTTSSPLDAADRCDRCGAQAFVRAILAGGELLFCAHHGRTYSDRLVREALHVDDQSARVNRQPSPAAY